MRTRYNPVPLKDAIDVLADLGLAKDALRERGVNVDAIEQVEDRLYFECFVAERWLGGRDFDDLTKVAFGRAARLMQESD